MIVPVLAGLGAMLCANPIRKLLKGKKKKSRGKKRKSAKALHAALSRAGKKGGRMKDFRKTLRKAQTSVADLKEKTGEEFHAGLQDLDYGGYSDNPFRKGKARKTTRKLGTIFKRKGKTYIVTKLRNGVKVARRWVNKGRK